MQLVDEAMENVKLINSEVTAWIKQVMGLKKRESVSGCMKRRTQNALQKAGHQLKMDVCETRMIVLVSAVRERKKTMRHRSIAKNGWGGYLKCTHS